MSSKVELFSPEYWKEWKARSNVKPPTNAAEIARIRALKDKTRDDKITSLNNRGYTYSHPNKGWVQGTGAQGEPNSMLADALAGGNGELNYRPENDHPNMIDLVGHNGDGVTGPFRSTYRGGPHKAKGNFLWSKAKEDRSKDISKGERSDVPFVKAASNFGSRKQPSSMMRTAPGVSFGSGTQHGNSKIPATTGPSVIKVNKSKLGGLFSGGGGIATTSIRAKGLGQPGPGATPNQSLVTDRIVVPLLGRTSRWGVADALEKQNKKGKTERMYDLPSIMGSETNTPHIYKSRAVKFGGGKLKDNLEMSIKNGGIDTTVSFVFFFKKMFEKMLKKW